MDDPVDLPSVNAWFFSCRCQVFAFTKVDNADSDSPGRDNQGFCRFLDGHAGANSPDVVLMQQIPGFDKSVCSVVKNVIVSQGCHFEWNPGES